MKKPTHSPPEVLATLKRRLDAVQRDLEETWREQAKLLEKEKTLESERQEIVGSIGVIQREFGIKASIPALDERDRLRKKLEARRAARSSSRDPRSLADAIDRVLHDSPHSLTAAEIHQEARKRLGTRSEASVADVRVALSRYGAARGWRKVSDERPARWIASSKNTGDGTGGESVK